jgi:hypothetical protein
MGQAKYQVDGDTRTSGPGFGLTLHADSLRLPYSWPGRRVVFVNSMSDLFHARVPLGFVRDVFAVIADTPQHTYQVLTKRSSRLPRIAEKLDWPSNLWLGVSVEDKDALFRVDDLRSVPAKVRFISCEPLLGPLDGLDLGGIDGHAAGHAHGDSGRHLIPKAVLKSPPHQIDHLVPVLGGADEVSLTCPLYSPPVLISVQRIHPVGECRGVGSRYAAHSLGRRREKPDFCLPRTSRIGNLLPILRPSRGRQLRSHRQPVQEHDRGMRSNGPFGQRDFEFVLTSPRCGEKVAAVPLAPAAAPWPRRGRPRASGRRSPGGRPRPGR